MASAEPPEPQAVRERFRDGPHRPAQAGTPTFSLCRRGWTPASAYGPSRLSPQRQWSSGLWCSTTGMDVRALASDSTTKTRSGSSRRWSGLASGSVTAREKERLVRTGASFETRAAGIIGRLVPSQGPLPVSYRLLECGPGDTAGARRRSPKPPLYPGDVGRVEHDAAEGHQSASPVRRARCLRGMIASAVRKGGYGDGHGVGAASMCMSCLVRSVRILSRPYQAGD